MLSSVVPKAVPVSLRQVPSAFIPIIDVAPLLSENRGLEAENVTSELMAAAREIGFIAVKNHGIPAALIHDVHVMSRNFFSLPEEAKLKCARGPWNSTNPFFLGYFPASADGKEGFDIGMHLGDRNAADIGSEEDVLELGASCPMHAEQPFPEELGEVFVECMREYRNLNQHLGRAVMRALAIGMGHEQDFFRRSLVGHSSILRLNHYPPRPASHTISESDGQTVLACSEHKDSGLLTLLWQDSIGGLEVQSKDTNRWLAVPPNLGDREGDAGVMLVNFGRFLEIWSEGQVQATNHRVRFQSNQSRLSIPFFLAPRGTTEIAVVPEGEGEAETVRYDAWMPKICAASFKEYEMNPAISKR